MGPIVQSILGINRINSRPEEILQSHFISQKIFYQEGKMKKTLNIFGFFFPVPQKINENGRHL
jgi:hypothetical protein